MRVQSIVHELRVYPEFAARRLYAPRYRTSLV